MGMTRRHASRCSRKRPAASRTRIPERQTLSSGSERAQTLEETGRVSAVAGEYEIDHRLSDSAANVHLGIWDNSLDPDSDRERRTDGRNDRCRCGSHGRDETGRSTHDRPLARAAWIASHGGVPPLLDRGRSEDQSSCEPAEVDRFSVSPGESSGIVAESLSRGLSRRQFRRAGNRSVSSCLQKGALSVRNQSLSASRACSERRRDWSRRFEAAFATSGGSASSAAASRDSAFSSRAATASSC